MTKPEEKFMRAAIEEAVKARENGDYAIGAIIVKSDQIIARSPNCTKSEQDPTQHAEVAVIRKAVKALGHRHLLDCTMYTTHEPCPMCSTAAIWARLKCVVVGARMNDMDEHRTNNGNSHWSWRTVSIPAREIFAKGDPKIEIVEDFMREDCRALFHA
jgi:tRNA(Arg) A34 adenosine deaminase TadA